MAALNEQESEKKQEEEVSMLEEKNKYEYNDIILEANEYFNSQNTEDKNI